MNEEEISIQKNNKKTTQLTEDNKDFFASFFDIINVNIELSFMKK